MTPRNTCGCLACDCHLYHNLKAQRAEAAALIDCMSTWMRNVLPGQTAASSHELRGQLLEQAREWKAAIGV